MTNRMGETARIARCREELQRAVREIGPTKWVAALMLIGGAALAQANTPRTHPTTAVMEAGAGHDTALGQETACAGAGVDTLLESDVAGRAVRVVRVRRDCVPAPCVAGAGLRHHALVTLRLCPPRE